jgi:hypothetical protein
VEQPVGQGEGRTSRVLIVRAVLCASKVPRVATRCAAPAAPPLHTLCCVVGCGTVAASAWPRQRASGVLRARNVERRAVAWHARPRTPRLPASLSLHVIVVAPVCVCVRAALPEEGGG